MKPPLLYLCHRIPYPPNKGDKIRSYHLLRHLCQHYRVFLGAFIDDERDWKYTTLLEELCEACCFIGLTPSKARIKSLSGLMTAEPLTLSYYRDRKLQQWVDEAIPQHKIERAIVYSSAMAQYIAPVPEALQRTIIDFVDIDSDKWRQYALKKHWPMSWIYNREARKLLSYEKMASELFDVSLFVSSAEAALFRSLIAPGGENISYYNNGVDTEYFSPVSDFVNPYADEDEVLIFTGAMDYWPNIDAVTWFAEEVFPEIQKKSAHARFYIVGGNPTEEVRRLANGKGVVVTGRVDDVRPYLHFARIAVAPMRIARGIQNKVLEAMAMEKPVIVSRQGVEGIQVEQGREILIADDRDTYIQHVAALLDGTYESMGAMARQRVIQDFNWAETLPLVTELLENRGLQIDGCNSATRR